MGRNSLALLYLFSVFIIKVTDLTNEQVRELRELIKDLSFIAAHPLCFGMTTMVVIMLFRFKMKVTATLLCLFSIIFIFLCVKVGELMGELKEALYYIAAHPVLFAVLVMVHFSSGKWIIITILKITVFLFHMSKWIIVKFIKISVFLFHMSKWIIVKIIKISVFVYSMCKRILIYIK